MGMLTVRASTTTTKDSTTKDLVKIIKDLETTTTKYSAGVANAPFLIQRRIEEALKRQNVRGEKFKSMDHQLSVDPFLIIINFITMIQYAGNAMVMIRGESPPRPVVINLKTKNTSNQN